ncbi:hsp90 co-chaperone Cdc37 [Rhizophlyctis rosea]|uniref:Hsp90 chaperone protein kinase-targeting subunit n=1 Tax=Rhizophlyctis rosea TaxID=64517 RepID=A0AAD5X8J6_9FUNG|nr:hsp90 co-chaperone Cdc37 [Rhizophlyctis rosea]
MPVGKSSDYSKWDKLELSDDDDFECHPNVDKASMVRWRQAKTHSDRRARKDKLTALNAETSTNAHLVATLATLSNLPQSSSVPSLLSHLESLQHEYTHASTKLKHDYDASQMVDRDARWGPPEADPFVEKRLKLGDLVKEVILGVSSLSADAPKDEMVNKLETAIKAVTAKIYVRQKAVDEEVRREEEEAKKKVTSEDIKEGFNKTILAKDKPKSTPAPSKSTSKVIETIHTPASTTTQPHLPTPDPEDDDDADVPEKITNPHLEKLSHTTSIDDAYKHLRSHPELTTQKYCDELLAEGFRREMEGKKTEAQNAIKNALLLQYCGLLGQDGINTFFTRLNTNPPAREMYMKDVSDTYGRIEARVATLKKESQQREEAEQEMYRQRLQAALQPDGSLALPVPEGEAEDSEARRRAEVFKDLPRDFQEALLLSDVDRMNDYFNSLGSEEAEKVVKRLTEVNLLELEVEEE